MKLLYVALYSTMVLAVEGWDFANQPEQYQVTPQAVEEDWGLPDRSNLVEQQENGEVEGTTLVGKLVGSERQDEQIIQEGMINRERGAGKPKQCPSGMISVPGSYQCFKYISERITRSSYAARARCKQDGLVLARPADSIAVSIRKLVAETYGSPDGVWIDARGTGSRMSWVGSSASINREMIAPWDRDDVDTNSCLALWAHVSPIKEYPTIPYGVWPCTDSKPILCQGGCSGSVFIGGQHLVFSKDKLTWKEAKKSCSAKNGRLVIPNDPQAIKSHSYSNYRGKHFWLGGSDIVNEGTWIWLDGTSVNPSFPWHHGEPNAAFVNEDCLVLWGGWAYSDAPCNRLYRYVCEC